MYTLIMVKNMFSFGVKSGADKSLRNEFLVELLD